MSELCEEEDKEEELMIILDLFLKLTAKGLYIKRGLFSCMEEFRCYMHIVLMYLKNIFM